MRRLYKIVLPVLLLLTSQVIAQTSTLSPEQSITSTGHARTFFYYQPSNFDPTRGIIIFFHGGGSNGSSAAFRATDNLFVNLADRVGILLLFPDGQPTIRNSPGKGTWNGCSNSRRTNCSACDGWDDVQFVRDLIPWATTNINGAIDTSRVYGAGESEGALFVMRLALEANDVIAAVGSAAGSLPVSNDNSPSGAYVCSGYTAPYAPGTGTPILLFKGTADPRIPYGSVSGPDSKSYCQAKDYKVNPPCTSGAVHSFYDTVAFWQWKFGISSSPSVQVAAASTIAYTDTIADCRSSLVNCDGSTVTRYNYGSAPYPVAVDIATNGGHVLPGPDEQSHESFRKFGWKNRDALGQPNPYIAEEMYAFFSQFTLGSI